MTENFKDETHDITLTRKDDCVVEMKIAASPETAEDSYKKALKNVGKEVSFPGFRKGKAPDKMVLSKYGPQVEREFKELMLNESVRRAMQLTEIYPWNRTEKIKADIEEASREKGGRFYVEFETFPSVPEVDPAEIEIKKIEAKEITDEDVEKHIRSLQYSNAEWEDANDRPVQDDDFVEVTIKTDDAERHGSFHVNKEHVEEWLYEFFIGKSVGEAGEATPPKPEGSEAEAAEQKAIEITIDKIKVPKLGELDDEFAKKYSAENMDDLKSKVRDYLEKQEKDRVKNQLHAVVQQKLTENYPFDIPASLKESERVNILNHLIQNYKQQQYSDEEISQIKDKLEEIAEQKAVSNIRTHYILLKVIDQKDFTVPKEEVMNELIQQSFKPDGTIDMDMVNNPDKHSAPIVRQLQMAKAMEYLAENVKIT